MKVTTTVTSLVAAASLVGAIGLAYAQTTGTTPTPQPAPMGAVDTPNNMNNTQTPGQMPAQTQAAPMTDPAMNAQPQLPPQADRN